MVLRRGLVACLVLAWAAAASAWWCTGHMLVANVAKQVMCPKAYGLVSKALEAESQYTPLTPDFVQAACWADDEKPTNGLFDTWHYVKLPLVDREPPTKKVPVPHGPNNVIWAIQTLNKTLSTSPLDRVTPTDVARALFFLIHFVGDLHQPLHATSLFSKKYEPPNGDVGGNNYMIKYQDFTNLHSFWDSGAGQWQDAQRPLNKNAYDELDRLASVVMSEFPADRFGPELKRYKVNDWAQESFALARDIAYKAPEAPTPLPDDYVRKAQILCRSQVALGGYRLSQLLLTIFPCS